MNWCVATRASTICSYIQMVEPFRHHTSLWLDRLTPARLRRYHLFLLEPVIDESRAITRAPDTA